jgi:uncharacterized repeat protein (TIGR02543 family)
MGVYKIGDRVIDPLAYEWGYSYLESTPWGDGTDVWRFYDSEYSIDTTMHPGTITLSGSVYLMYHGNGSTGVFNNILTGGTASAISNYSTYTANKATDANITTYWRPTSTTSPCWWQYDLGAGNESVAFVISIYTINSGYCRQTFEIKVSNDTLTWDSVSTGNILLGKASSWEKFYFISATPKRYIRLYFTNHTDGVQQLYEVQVSDSIDSVGPTCSEYRLYENAVVVGNFFNKPGYIFTGWNTTSSGTGDNYTVSGTIYMDDCKILYAQWEET